MINLLSTIRENKYYGVVTHMKEKEKGKRKDL